MAMTPNYALAHVFLPNLVKLKGAATVVGVIERKEKFFFDAVWAQAHIEHAPYLFAQNRDPYRIGVVNLPAPKDMGEVFFVGIVANKADPQLGRYFTLEHDYVLAKKEDRTLICERVGTKHTKHFDGPELTGNNETDAIAFIDAFMELMVPTKATEKNDRQW
jgi:hypothetical protein